MKKLQLPYHRKMKQTTLNSFIAAKKKNEHQSSCVVSQKINVNSPTLDISSNLHDVNFTNRAKHTTSDCIYSNTNETFVSTHGLQIMCNSNEQQCCTKPQCELVSNEIETVFSDDDKENYYKTHSESLACDSLICSNSRIMLNVDDESLSETESEVSYSTANNSSVTNYDLTMKFVSDSQGNKIFDHFTQKHKAVTLPSIEEDNLLTTSEQYYYQNFEEDLMNNDLWQSTEKF